MKYFGLIGYPLSHSFSMKYFAEKFSSERIANCRYEAYEIRNIQELPELIKSQTDLIGLNVTIPYKQEVIPYLDELNHSAEKVGAVNVIKIQPDGKLIGFNSDYYGFRTSLESWIKTSVSGFSALILGTGGASKAVRVVCDDCNIKYRTVSRNKMTGDLTYLDLIDSPEIIADYKLIINTTPLGMYPKINEAPNLPYTLMDSSYYLYDLIYNPEITLFMKNGMQNGGANVKNGMEMLVLQAEKSWEIWNSQTNGV